MNDKIDWLKKRGVRYAKVYKRWLEQDRKRKAYVDEQMENLTTIRPFETIALLEGRVFD